MTGALLWVGVAVLGGFGALARFTLDGAVARRVAGDFPWGTWSVNVVGAFLAGAVAGAAVTGSVRTLVAVGALGSFSTFSTWMLESQRLAEERRSGLALVNLAAGFASGLGAAAVGWAVGSLL